MTEADIEKEIYLRVEFKVNQINAALQNLKAFYFKKAFDGNNPAYSYMRDAIEKAQEIVHKEKYMPLPVGEEHDNMLLKQKRDKVIEKVSDEIFDRYMRGRVGYKEKARLIKLLLEVQNA